MEARMSTPPRFDGKAIRVSTLEGKQVFGGELLVKLRLQGEQMIMLEIFYAAGVGTPLHSHDHESVIYLVSGKLKGTMDGKEVIMQPGDVCRQPEGRSARRGSARGFGDRGMQITAARYRGVHGIQVACLASTSRVLSSRQKRAARIAGTQGQGRAASA
jgi:quercetin dioxygenase-like cupin family protein